MNETIAFNIWLTSAILLLFLFFVAVIGGITIYYKIRAAIELEKQKWLRIQKENEAIKDGF